MSACLPAAGFKAQACFPTLFLAWQILLGKTETSLQTLFVVGAFWFTDCSHVNHPVSSSPPPDRI